MDSLIGSGPRAYLDWAASAPLRPEAHQAMADFLGGSVGNPSGAHAEGRAARRALDDARDQIAEALGAEPGEIVLTSGGTESDGLAIHGAFDALVTAEETPQVVVCSAFEHHAVLEACRAVAGRHGADLRLVPATSDGTIDLGALAAACTPDVGLVSVMTVNNELGTIQPMDAVARTVRGRSPSAVLHTDAVQAAPWMDLAPVTALVDLLSISAHKFGGPVGAGALVVRTGVGLKARLEGGGQERGRRSGTNNVAAGVGMAAALAATADERAETSARVASLRDRLESGLVAAIDGVEVSGVGADRVPGILHLRLAGVESEALVVLLDQAGVAASAGAACSSGATEASHVLEAMGLDPTTSRSGLRLSLGTTTSLVDVERAREAVPAAVQRLRN